MNAPLHTLPEVEENGSTSLRIDTEADTWPLESGASDRTDRGVCPVEEGRCYVLYRARREECDEEHDEEARQRDGQTTHS